tara:strand:- start:286 stop:492 length:207 start_codon:yes stop_codon:yes gene_type:complete
MLQYNLKASTSDNAKKQYDLITSHISYLQKAKAALEKDCIEQGLLEKQLIGEVDVAAHKRKKYAKIWK